MQNRKIRKVSTLKTTFVSVVIPWVLWTAAYADCPLGDLNRDCRVDGFDWALFARTWRAESTTPSDLDGSGVVDWRDLALFSDQWQKRGCPIVINELLAHAHDEASDWIELHNVSSVPVDIGGWFLSDKEGDLRRYEIAAGTIIDPCGYLTFYEATHFANPFDPGVRTAFAFSENGEVACLSSGDDPNFPDCLVTESFEASETSYSFGRYLKSTGAHDFVTMSEVTPGASNAYPRVGPVVINEIMYHPASDDDAEYIELFNVSNASVTLYDYTCGLPWRLRDDSGINFSFPTDEPVTLAPSEHVLLARDLAAVQQQHNVPANAKVFSWVSGKLANSGEELRLVKPGDVDDLGTRYWIEVDRVAYSDGAHGENFADDIDPWPVEADGQGHSLNRTYPSRYGNDPNNWQATIPTPGAAND